MSAFNARAPRGVDICAAARYNGGMEGLYARTALLLGEAGAEKLKGARVAVFGLGGVGSWCAEALARAGVGSLTLVDKDAVEESNCNRQLVALSSTIGRYKAEVMAERVRDINPACEAIPRVLFYLPETSGELPLGGYDYIADCIDNVTAKVRLVLSAKEAGVPVISAMGAGNKLEGGRFRVSDLAQTSVCPLARVMRRLCKERNIPALKVVYSTEPPVIRSREPASVSFVPSVCGLVMAGALIKDLVNFGK